MYFCQLQNGRAKGTTGTADSRVGAYTAVGMWQVSHSFLHFFHMKSESTSRLKEQELSDKDNSNNNSVVSYTDAEKAPGEHLAMCSLCILHSFLHFFRMKIESTSRLKEQKLNDKDNGNNNNSVYTDAEKSTWWVFSCVYPSLKFVFWLAQQNLNFCWRNMASCSKW